MSEFGHLVEDSGWKVGDKIVTLCGEEIEAREDMAGKPVCYDCFLVAREDLRFMIDVALDLKERMREISEALSMKDFLGQSNLIHSEARDAINAAYWRPGDACNEGPLREDGTF